MTSKNDSVFNNREWELEEIIDLARTRMALWIKGKYNVKDYSIEGFKRCLEWVRRIKIWIEETSLITWGVGVGDSDYGLLVWVCIWFILCGLGLFGLLVWVSFNWFAFFGLCSLGVIGLNLFGPCCGLSLSGFGLLFFCVSLSLWLFCLGLGFFRCVWSCICVWVVISWYCHIWFGHLGFYLRLGPVFLMVLCVACCWRWFAWMGGIS